MLSIEIDVAKSAIEGTWDMKYYDREADNKQFLPPKFWVDGRK
jgi:hypothetical protein